MIAGMISRRRRLLLAAGLAGTGAAALALTGWRLWPEQGLSNPCLGALPPQLAAHPIVRDAIVGLDHHQVWDAHAHLLGVGDHAENAGFNDAGFNEHQGTLYWPLAAVQRHFFLDAACLGNDVNRGKLDAAYVERLRALSGELPRGQKILLFALDLWHDPSGQAAPEHTHAWVGNDYCATVASAWPERFEWVASVHPYRKDATAELERVHALGARAIKWIPAAQGIDPGAQRCDAFYATLSRLNLPLISHAGAERAAPGDDALGNPLQLRRALGQGVRVVVAHCASIGESRDTDRGANGPWTGSFTLFERMMDEPRYFGRLFGDISAMTQSARAGAPLRRVIERAGAPADGGGSAGEWATRLLNGSDYPLPGIMPLYSPRLLADTGLLDAADVAPLSALRGHNPLLFDFVLKRRLRSGGKRLAAAVFETRRFFEPGKPA